MKFVVLPMAAGLTMGEVAAKLDRERAEFRHLAPPPRGVITKSWVSARLRGLRRDIAESGAGDILSRYSNDTSPWRRRAPPTTRVAPPNPTTSRLLTTCALRT